MFAFLLKIWGLARPYRWRLLLGAFMGILAGFMEPAFIATIAFVYGVVFPAKSDTVTEQLEKTPEFLRHWLTEVNEALSSGIQKHPWAIVALVSLIPAVMFLRGLFSYLNIYLLQWVAVRTISDLRVRLFGHLMNLSAGFFTKSHSGELMARITNDTTSLMVIISNATAVVVKDPVTLISLFAYLMWDPERRKLSLISLVVLPLCIIPIAIYGRKVRKSAGTLQMHSAKLVEVMAESFAGNRIIKAYNLEHVVVRRFRATTDQAIGLFMRIVRAQEIPGPVTEFFGSVGLALMILYVLTKPGGAGSAENFLKLVGSIFAMYRPVKNLARLHNNVQQAEAASERVFELLATPNSIVEPANPKPLQAAGAEIRFDGITFAYDSKPVLEDIQLTVKPGQMVALVGRSGSGKTTLTNLLLRFYDPQKGAVRIGGLDIREAGTADLRNQMAVVSQEIVLFNETIRRNIELGRPGATDAEIEAAAKRAHAHEFITAKTGGYAAVIGERGVELSGGQRQRIAIARAVLRNAPILILDEATSALDTESELAVQAGLEELMVGRTTICIAHRLSTIQKADLIVVLEAGRIVEQGKHEELQRLNGVYRKLHDLQFNA